MRILIADDETDLRKLIALTLKRRGFDVLEAESGDVALKTAISEQPHLVILDVMMPVQTGIEVARALAINPATSSIPVIFVSAKGQVADIADGLKTGAKAYLVKPFETKDLLDLIEKTIPEPNMRKRNA